MVFKPINLARQSFVKTFTHGYAQSLVAASQSSSVSQNTSFTTLFSKGQHVAHPHNVHQGHAIGQASGIKTLQPDNGGSEGGLAAYYAAWQRHRKSEEKEAHQLPFAKRIGWKAPTTIPDTAVKPKDAVAPATPQRPAPTRSYTESAIDTIASVDLKDALTQDANKDATPAFAATAADRGLEGEPVVESAQAASLAPADSFSSIASDIQSSSPTQSTEATSVSEGDAYTDHLTNLAEQQQYGDIPAVFEAMLVAGIKPSASAYNALFLAAINLPRGKHQVASKVLDVYADMLRRRVLPDTSTYAIVIELLAARTRDVIAMRKELAEKRTRYGGMESEDSFMLRSDETEAQILAEDDSLSMAIKLFDTSAAVTANHLFSAETYRLLISACAETGRIGDMVRIYADMESQQITPPSAIFSPMIEAFASTGDLRSAVECYNEYKALAIAHDNGGASIVRKDDEVYASVVKAYSICGRQEGASNFMERIEANSNNADILHLIRDTVAVQSLHPSWMKEGKHASALDHAKSLTFEGQQTAYAAICIDAANKGSVEVALQAFELLASQSGGNTSEPAMAVLAMQVRNGDANGALAIWNTLRTQEPSVSFIEPTVMFALSAIGCGNAEGALIEARDMFSRIRSQNVDSLTKTETLDRIDEAIDVVSAVMFKNSAQPAIGSSLQLIKAMVENSNLATSLTEQLLAGIGAEQMALLSQDDVLLLTQIEASMLLHASTMDVAHSARFAGLHDIVLKSGMTVDARTEKLVQDALVKLGRPDLLMQWQSRQLPPPTPAVMPAAYAPTMDSSPSYGYEDSFDPYGSNTDFKGSGVIAEELEKTYGRPSQHLTEALSRFRNMRRAGRHPRYITYAKLIGAAAKSLQFNTVEDIYAMAKQDVPFLARSKVVRHGWISILDSMVGACLTVGRRDAAEHFHQELLSMGSAPSANTYGLYITTLKESTKTFDEATEAVKIFHQAKSEGVEPSSFLYNALIGKLGKARRIDDCLFYFAEMRNLGIRPTSVTYGTIVNALCRVSDDKFAEELFEEMESMSNYKPRPAPYNSLMQYFLTTKRDRTKVLAYYERMKANHITPTMHTYKLLIDTYATLEPVNLAAAETVIDEIRAGGAHPEAVHFASLVHAKGCVLHDMAAARALFDSVLADSRVKPQACLYQALFESYVANHDVAATESLLEAMKARNVPLTPYIANTLIHGWATAKDITKARAIFDRLGRDGREPSTYEAMTRANLACDMHGEAMKVVGEALRRGYPSAVANKICELVSGAGGNAASTASPALA